MKTIFRIAKTELRTLFFSPVAWIVLMIFAFQSGMLFCDSLDQCIKYNALGKSLYNLTAQVFTKYALFSSMQKNLYMYIPLLTMGLISREINSGSIKLLFSSPITNIKIVLGKYFAMVMYCFVFILILTPLIIFGIFGIKDLDIPTILTAGLGMFLLICAYSAIGLFMSCLTSYQVVAAMGTFAVLAVLNYIGEVGQSFEFVRDITYWLSISSRTDDFLVGLIGSEDFIYFIIVISLFLIFSIIKLNSSTNNHSLLKVGTKYIGALLIAILLGYITTIPALKVYYDSTATKSNTLTKNSQEILAKLEGGMTINSYCNLLDNDFYVGSPENVNDDKKRFAKYLRFKPEIKMNYIYYYDKVNNPNIYYRHRNMNEKQIAKRLCKVHDYNFKNFLSPEEIKNTINLSSEENVFVRQIVRENGQKTFLRLFNDNGRHPSETEVVTALKRLMVKAPKVGFLTGHGERSIERNRDKDYSAFVNNRKFRYSLINQGFDGVKLSLEKEIPDDIDIIVIADIRESFTKEETNKLDNYISRGGNLIIASDVNRDDIMNPFLKQFGVSLLPGILVQPGKDKNPTLVVGNLTEDSKDISKKLYYNYCYNYKTLMSGVAALKYSETSGFKVTPLLTTKEKGIWNELETTDFEDERAKFNPNVGESEKSYNLALALSRNIANKEQRIIVLGDSDFISNVELSASNRYLDVSNISFIPGMFQWLSYNQYPLDTSRQRSSDDELYVYRKDMLYVKIGFMGLIPALLGIFGTLLWFKRKRQ